ncbi:trypsin-like serine peptidase [Pseudoroseomonas globiformis]|uniref:Trypsin-like serine peptidase n=1 Tax=Teichococcus globiformis TaxID=2307229 RepID=A0ABV7FXP5_9PROT
MRPGVGEADPRHPVSAGAVPWNALGRVQTELGGRCTGAMIAPDRVLTAAHCLVTPRTGRLVQPGSIHMMLGYDRGTWRGTSPVKRFLVAPGFDPVRRGPPEADWAVLTLERKLGGTPLPLFRQMPPAGARLMLGGYQQDRREVLLADTDCHLLGSARGPGGTALLRHGCAATRGASGGPLLVETAHGSWAILGVAVASFADRPAGLAVPASALPPLAE